MTTNKWVGVIVLLGTFFVTCQPKDEPVPAYLHISEFTLKVSGNNTQGRPDHDFKDAWVFVDDKTVGVFEVPVTIPLLYEGQHEIKIFPGVKQNGRINDRVLYPLVQSYRQTINFTKTRIDSVQPEIEFFPTADFKWVEDFEDNSVSLETSGSPTEDSLFITSSPEEVYNYDGVLNQYSGKVLIDKGTQEFENATINFYDIPRNVPVYLEVNYKGAANMQFALIGERTDALIPLVVAFATEEWKKLYINLSLEVNNPAFQGEKFKIAVYSVSNFDEGPKAVYFDNFKLIHL